MESWQCHTTGEQRWETWVQPVLENSRLSSPHQLASTHKTEGITSPCPSLVSRQLPSLYPSNMMHALCLGAFALAVFTVCMCLAPSTLAVLSSHVTFLERPSLTISVITAPLQECSRKAPSNRKTIQGTYVI